MDFLRHVIANSIYPVMDGIFTYLTASDVGSLLDATGTREGFCYGVRYLNPLRDIDPSMKYLGDMLRDHTILMLGEDMPALNMRIMDSERYWGSECSGIRLGPYIWVLAIPKRCDECVADALGHLISCNTVLDEYPWTVHARKFADIVARKILKQVYVQDDYIGHVGDETDWDNRDWVPHCISSVYVDGGTCTETTVGMSVMIPKVPGDPDGHNSANISFRELRFHIDWEDVYRVQLWTSESWGEFAYINASEDPLTVRRSATTDQHGASGGLNIVLHRDDNEDAYISLL